MKWPSRRQVWRLNRAVHRDLGYFTSALLIVYCVSGIALNHIDDWNPDFQIDRQEITIPKALQSGEMTDERVDALSLLVGEKAHRIYDSPVRGHVKIYYDNATLHIRFDEGTGIYERVTRRPIFYQVNVLHRNSFKPWRWGADIFALLLIIIGITGLFVLKGKNGLTRRGIWLIIAGALPPIIVLFLHG